LAFDLIYCLALEDTERHRDRRAELDSQLDRFAFAGTAATKPDRATWGKLPQHQRAMRAAQDAGGNVGARPRVAGRR
jgi:hypothetical protein